MQALMLNLKCNLCALRVAAGIVSQMVLWVTTSKVTVIAYINTTYQFVAINNSFDWCRSGVAVVQRSKLIQVRMCD